MAETTQTEKTQTEKKSGRKTLVGQVTSTKMAKTIVVQVSRQKAHPLYERVIAQRARQTALHMASFTEFAEA